MVAGEKRAHNPGDHTCQSSVAKRETLTSRNQRIILADPDYLSNVS